MNGDIVSIGEILFDIYPDHKTIGGAPFNFIYHILKITGKGKFISRIGNDRNGKEILEFLEERKISKEYIQTDNEHATGTVKVKLSENKVPDFIIAENQAGDFLESGDKEKLLLKNASLIYFGTLMQRNSVSRYTIGSFLNMDRKYFLDVNIRQNYYTKEILNGSLKSANVVKLNEDELKIINDLLLNHVYDLRETSLRLAERFDFDLLCVTLGENGALLFNKSESDYYKEEVTDVIDTVGAGDAYAAILAIGYLNDWDLPRINKTASEFAGTVCKINGALPVNDGFYDNIRKKI